MMILFPLLSASFTSILGKPSGHLFPPSLTLYVIKQYVADNWPTHWKLKVLFVWPNHSFFGDPSSLALMLILKKENWVVGGWKGGSGVGELLLRFCDLQVKVPDPHLEPA